MSISIKMIDMITKGDVVQLVVMGVLFILIIIMLSRLGKGIDAIYNKPAAENVPQPAAVISPDGVTAAIAAAVKQYKKNN